MDHTHNIPPAEEIPDWAVPYWDKYVEAGGTTLPHSGVWEYYRYDIAWYHETFVAPLQKEISELRKVVEGLSSPSEGIQTGSSVTITGKIKEI